MVLGNQPPPDAQADLDARVRFPPQPPEGFDPLQATPAQLDQYGIPQRPDAEVHPRSAEFWEEMFSPPLDFVQERLLLNMSPRTVVPVPHVAVASRRESSLNWSGLYITPRDGQQLTEVHGRWRVPLVSPPAGAGPAAVFSSSTWIGLDGQRQYHDASLPQLGTTQSINDPANPPYWMWWQWWQPDNPLTHWPATIPINVDPLDRILASIYVVNPTAALFIIVNRTKNRIMLYLVLSPQDPPIGRRAWISGATAEWIMERPTDHITGDFYDLPDYDEVRFSNCFAMSAGLPWLSVASPSVERSLEGGRLIRMYRSARPPSRTVTISKAELPDGYAFKTVYVP